jgi:hypothetical protein
MRKAVLRQPSSVHFVGRSAEEPVLLMGPPGRLAGWVRLRNPGAAAVVLRHAVISDRSGHLSDMPPHHRFAPIVLRPGDDRTVELAIELPAATPTGEYRVELDITGQVRPAVLNVEEFVALRVEPTRIVVMEGKEQPQSATLFVSNEGNKRLSIGDIGDVDLHDDVAEVRNLRGAIRSLLDDVVDKPDELIAVLLALVPLREPILGRLAVRMSGTPIQLDPGQTKKIDLEIRVPSDLRARGRYRGRAAILTANVDFVVIPSVPLATADTESVAEPVPANRARRLAGRPGRKD